MSTNRNAYEIRADILGQAQGLLQSKYEREMTIWEQSLPRHPDTGSIIDPSKSEVTKPAFPTTQEILKTANELYTFVDNRNTL